MTEEALEAAKEDVTASEKSMTSIKRTDINFLFIVTLLTGTTKIVAALNADSAS